jgi:hypothetical protein
MKRYTQVDIRNHKPQVQCEDVQKHKILYLKPIRNETIQLNILLKGNLTKTFFQWRLRKIPYIPDITEHAGVGFHKEQSDGKHLHSMDPLMRVKNSLADKDLVT